VTPLPRVHDASVHDASVHVPLHPAAGRTVGAASTDDTHTREADDLDETWGAPGGITTGDVATVAALHLPQLLALAAVLTGDTRSAGDVVTAVLARLPTAGATAPTTRPDLRLRRLLLREHRSYRHRRSRQSQPAAPWAPRTGRRGREERAKGVAIDPLWAALDALPHRARTVLVLRYHQHLSDEDIAAVVGRRPAVVRARATRGLTALHTTNDTPAPAPSTEEPQ